MNASRPLRVALFAATGFQADDAFITYRYAENLARGLGFVYNAGERVYGTTTPLLTLVLAGAARLGAPLPLAALAVNLAATAAILYAAARLLAPRAAPPVVVLALGLLVLAPSHAVWSVSGMETALFVALLVLGLWAYADRRWLPLGLAGGGLFLARFDGFIFVLAVVAAELWLAWRAPAEATGRWRGYAVAAAALALVVAPWLAFAGWYFHDIVPNSVWAKLALYRDAGFDRTTPVALLRQALRLGEFLPAAMEAPAALAALAALAMRRSRLIVLPVWFFAYLGFLLLGRTHIHPWYVVPLHVVALLSAVAAAAPWIPAIAPRRIAAAAATALALLAAVALPAAFREAAARQRVYEAAHAELGRFLRDRAAPGDVVYAWDIGYIGYLSGRRILDFVGIVSPEVIAANARRDFLGVLRRHRPDWAVVGLYGNAFRQIVDSAWFRDAYAPVHRTAVPGLESWSPDDPRRLAAYRPDYVVYRLRRGAAGAPVRSGLIGPSPQD